MTTDSTADSPTERAVESRCPRCDHPLVADVESTALRCHACEGYFVAGRAVHADYIEAADTATDLEQITCPGCQATMTEMRLGDVSLDRCERCGGLWLDAGETVDAQNPSALQQWILYSLTLPERVVRSTVGVAAGAAFETASVLVPRSFQNAKTYKVVVHNSLKFLTENVGGVASDSEEPANDDFIARKAVGNFVDLAGMATLHLSPMWVLAIVSDVAYGTKAYVQELAKELEQQGLIDDSSAIHHVDDVLEAIQNTSGNAAGLFDTPPLSVEQLRETLDETREALNSPEYSKLIPESEVTRYWEEMRSIASAEDVSLLGVSGALAMNTLGKLNTVSKGALTGVQVVGGLFNEHVLGHYAASLKTIRAKGFYETVRDSSSPYVEAVWNNFSTDRPTITDDVVSGRLFSRSWKAVTGWFAGRKETPAG